MTFYITQDGEHTNIGRNTLDDVVAEFGTRIAKTAYNMRFNDHYQFEHYQAGFGSKKSDPKITVQIKCVNAVLGSDKFRSKR